MRISNEGSGAASPFEELFRLQSDFQTRLAEETLKYLRLLQGMIGPVVPGTVVAPATSGELSGAGHPGERVELTLEVENRQRVHCMVTPMLGPLVSSPGVTWFPAAQAKPVSMLVPPGETRDVILEVPLPTELEPATYRGALLLYGFREGGIPVAVTVRSPKAEGSPTKKKARSTKKGKVTKESKAPSGKKKSGGTS